MPLPKYALAAAMALTMSAPAFAQNRIGGVVRDETGSTIRGATVRAETGGTVSSAAPVTLTTATDDRGRFVFVVVRSGEWRLTIEAPGFDPQTIPLAVRLAAARPRILTSSSTAASLQKRSARWLASTPNLCRGNWQPPPCCTTKAGTIRHSRRTVKSRRGRRRCRS